MIGLHLIHLGKRNPSFGMAFIAQIKVRRHTRPRTVYCWLKSSCVMSEDVPDCTCVPLCTCVCLCFRIFWSHFCVVPSSAPDILRLAAPEPGRTQWPQSFRSPTAQKHIPRHPETKRPRQKWTRSAWKCLQKVCLVHRFAWSYLGLKEFLFGVAWADQK